MLQGDAWVVVSIQQPLGEDSLSGTSEAHSHSPRLASSSLCSGWIAAVSTLQPKHLALSIIMMVVAGFFTLCAVLSVFLLKRVSGGCWANSKPEEASASLLP